MKVYLDNVIVSALVRDDLASPDEQRALKLLQEHRNFGKLEIVTSRESWREQDRTRCEKTREELRSSRDKTPVVSGDHKLLASGALISGIAASSRRRSSRISWMRRCSPN